jgi:hypothetical protein
MINFVFNIGGVDYTSLIVAVASLFITFVALVYGIRQFRLSAEMNYATMTVNFIDKINIHSNDIIKAMEMGDAKSLRFSVIDLANTLDLACVFRLSHKTKGPLSSYFMETLDASIRFFNDNPEWLSILTDSIQRPDEFTGLKEYTACLANCDNLLTVLAKQRRTADRHLPWLN